MIYKLKKLIWILYKPLLLRIKFFIDFKKYRKLSKHTVCIKDIYPFYNDATLVTEIEPTYFYQDTWAFERIVNNKTTRHVDIGSHHTFVALLSKVVEMTMVDIRPFSLPLQTIHFIEGSITNLPFEDNSIDSLSSLCVIEHVGLGRYGDPIDPEGSNKAFNEINRVLKQGAIIYISLPVSSKIIVRFNAGIIFNNWELLKILENDYIIKDKKYIYKSRLIEEFIPDDNFGTTILLELQKK